MIVGLEGKLVSRAEDSAVLDVNGVSYCAQTSATTLAALGPPGDRIRLHTHLQVRDDSLSLYGFATLDELKAFQLLISVSGVGPKMALAILSVMSPDRFALALTSGDADAFGHVPGVGKKSAARIILDLKGKFEQDIAPVRSIHEDVKLALMGLGYSASEAAIAAAGIPDSTDLTLEEKIRLALRHFARTA